MPWTKADVDKHNKGLTPAQKDRWVRVANSALERCMEDSEASEPTPECEASAIKQANSAVAKTAEVTELYIFGVPVPAHEIVETYLSYISEGGPKSGWYRPPKGTHGPGSQGGKDKPPKGIRRATYGKYTAFHAERGVEVPENIRNQSALMMMSANGDLVIFPTKDTSGARHAEFAAAMGMDSKEFDSTTRFSRHYAVYGAPEGGFEFTTPFMGWPRGEPADSMEADVQAARKIKPLARGLIDAGYGRDLYVDWAMNTAEEPAESKLGDWVPPLKEWIQELLREGGPKSGWYRPPKGTHGPGSQGGKDKPPTPGRKVDPMAGQRPTDAGRKANELLEDYLLTGGSDEPRPPGSISVEAEKYLSDVKSGIVTDIAEKAGVSLEDSNNVASAWADSSNDEDMNSLSIQQDISKTFDVPLSDYTKGKIKETLGAGGDAADRRTDETTQTKVLSTMYDETQTQLAGLGLKPEDTVTLYRGIIVPDSVAAPHDDPEYKYGTTMRVEGNALSSWTTREGYAEEFAEPPWAGESGMVLAMDVPVSSILSTSRTGLGCLFESEVTVIGAGGDAEVRAVIN